MKQTSIRTMEQIFDFFDTNPAAEDELVEHLMCDNVRYPEKALKALREDIYNHINN